MHAGSEEGFVEGALLVFRSKLSKGDYHGDMDSTNFIKWAQEMLIPNLKRNCVIVMDNARYHNVYDNPPPNANSRKREIFNWLMDKIDLNDIESYSKNELVSILKEIRPNYINFKIDKLFQEHGHVVLRLPPYHPHINPIEKVWGVCKRRIAAENVMQTPQQVENLIHKHFDGKHPELWKNSCLDAIKREEEHLKNDFHVEISDLELLLETENVEANFSEYDDPDIFDLVLTDDEFSTSVSTVSADESPVDWSDSDASDPNVNDPNDPENFISFWKIKK